MVEMFKVRASGGIGASYSYGMTLAVNPAAHSVDSPVFPSIPSCPVELLIIFFFSVLLSLCQFLLLAITKLTS